MGEIVKFSPEKLKQKLYKSNKKHESQVSINGFDRKLHTVAEMSELEYRTKEVT